MDQEPRERTGYTFRKEFVNLSYGELLINTVAVDFHKESGAIVGIKKNRQGVIRSSCKCLRDGSS